MPRRQRTLRPLMMRMATRKDSSSVHAPLSRYVKSRRAAQNVRRLLLRRLAPAAPRRRDAQDRVLHYLIAVEAVQAAERSRRHAVANA